ncbi:MAG: hypothetical protein OEW16_07645 [Gammaproteobacteria bacterium]|nr:hypothetical protein [Gammaproteobacteria bacterium]
MRRWARRVDQERFVLTKIVIGSWLVALAAILWLLWRSKKVF